MERTWRGVRANRAFTRRHHQCRRHGFVQPARTGDGAGKSMNPRAKKIILLLLAATLLFSSGQVQISLNRDRAQLGLTHADPLNNAPPILAFTTVALGGFRGL